MTNTNNHNIESCPCPSCNRERVHLQLFTRGYPDNQSFQPGSKVSDWLPQLASGIPYGSGVNVF